VIGFRVLRLLRGSPEQVDNLLPRAIEIRNERLDTQ
jgi:hypothetical protein